MQASPLHLVYGGTFDPIHLGHLLIARAARDRLHCDVHLMPAGDPPHRAPPGACAEDRARMVALAIADEPGMVLDRHELEQRGPSYTVGTLEALRDRLGPTRPLAWLIGADSLLGLTRWHRWRDLLALAHLVVAERPGSGLDEALPAALAEALQGRWCDAPDTLSQAPGGRVLRLHQPLHPASATAVRARLADGAPVGDLLTPAVAAFIRNNGLYRPVPVARL